MGRPAARILDRTVHGGVVTTGTPRVMIGNKPAARIGDMHTCPMFTGPVPHVGGPLIFGALNVYSAGPPQSRTMDMCICVGPPDLVALGHIKTHVGMMGAFGGGLGGFLGLMASGLAAGWKNLLGEYPKSFATARDAANPDGFYTVYAQNDTTGGQLIIRGTSEFQQQVITDLDTISSTNSGRNTIQEITASGYSTTIVETNGGNGASYDNPANRLRGAVGGPNNTGTNSTVSFNPNRTILGNNSQPWMNRPTDVGLFHELRHASDAAQGAMDPGTSVINGRVTRNREAQAVGLGPYAGDANTENTYRQERGEPQRTQY